MFFFICFILMSLTTSYCVHQMSLLFKNGRSNNNWVSKMLAEWIFLRTGNANHCNLLAYVWLSHAGQNQNSDYCLIQERMNNISPVYYCPLLDKKIRPRYGTLYWQDSCLQFSCLQMDSTEDKTNTSPNTSVISWTGISKARGLGSLESHSEFFALCCVYANQDVCVFLYL